MPDARADSPPSVVVAWQNSVTSHRSLHGLGSTKVDVILGERLDLASPRCEDNGSRRTRTASPHDGGKGVQCGSGGMAEWGGLPSGCGSVWRRAEVAAASRHTSAGTATATTASPRMAVRACPNLRRGSRSGATDRLARVRVLPALRPTRRVAAQRGAAAAEGG
ncbi:hypothetical protein K438DRAFT_1763133 [Mycena galopus ATCC 62051]|nr:hypothetical protein K438DRAFT_1763133 [Mycena galopus ATCC 62051]